MDLAIIKTGGKQYLVKKGDKIKVEKLKGEVGENVEFDTILTTDEAGDKVEIGKPLLKTKVKAKILKQDRKKKVSVVKYKSKTRYNKTVGHRQPYTEIQIEAI
jgi:large subunit ribosomal protein L21